MRLLLVLAAIAAVVLSLPVPAAAKDKSTDDSKKVCVAVVANASTTSAFVEQMTERLLKSLKQDKVDAVGMDSRTTTHYPLEFSKENGEESRQKQCDYILLSQIRDPRQHPFEPRLPEISIGGPVPSTDASDPSASARPNLQVAFALFHSGRFKPIVETYVLDRPGPNAADTLWLAMDREANRVRSELKKARLPE
ncbi:MAG TPA: hypothetical protein VKR26_12300 [Terriglobales bacterium]|nr:hypothetical protein [Terriglobales bacterium]